MVKMVDNNKNDASEPGFTTILLSRCASEILKCLSLNVGLRLFKIPMPSNKAFSICIIQL